MHYIDSSKIFGEKTRWELHLVLFGAVWFYDISTTIGYFIPKEKENLIIKYLTKCDIKRAPNQKSEGSLKWILGKKSENRMSWKYVVIFGEERKCWKYIITFGSGKSRMKDKWIMLCAVEQILEAVSHQKKVGWTLVFHFPNYPSKTNKKMMGTAGKVRTFKQTWIYQC